MLNFVFKFFIFIAGFIDSIVGGGGLITLPVFTLLVGPGASAIGTNKVVGTIAALTALLVYTRHGHLRLKTATSFFLSVCVGSILGSKLALILPVEIFKYLIIGICPIFLYIILRKKSLLSHHHPDQKAQENIGKLILFGLLCGIYDGVLGPGGGTLMLLSLVIGARLPLMVAIASSKFANVISASTALASYSISGVVHWSVGLEMAPYAFIGALLGSTLANKKAEKITRPLLVLVVVGLMIKLIFE